MSSGNEAHILTRAEAFAEAVSDRAAAAMRERGLPFDREKSETVRGLATMAEQCGVAVADWMP